MSAINPRQTSSQRSGQHLQQGNAMLEFVLLLPIYVIILCLVIAMGEYGQVASQVYHSARLMSWLETDSVSDYPSTVDTGDTVDTIFFSHFGTRVDVLSDTAYLTPLDYDASDTEQNLNGTSTYANVSPGSYSYMHDALSSDGSATTYYTEVDQTRADDGYGSAVSSLSSLTTIALNGDTSAAGTDIPWLRSKYSVVSVGFTPMGTVISEKVFSARGGVRRFPSGEWSTQSHAPYTDPDMVEATLRDQTAYDMDADNTGVIGEPGDDLHQLDYLDMSGALTDITLVTAVVPEDPTSTDSDGSSDDDDDGSTSDYLEELLGDYWEDGGDPVTGESFDSLDEALEYYETEYADYTSYEADDTYTDDDGTEYSAYSVEDGTTTLLYIDDDGNVAFVYITENDDGTYSTSVYETTTSGTTE